MITEIQQAIINEAVSWLGTPYDYGSAEKGKGIDCAKFLLAVYKKVGLIRPGFQPPHMNPDWSFKADADPAAFKEFILKCGHEVPFDERLPGDIVSYQFPGYAGRLYETHLAILIENDLIIHAVRDHEVMRHRMTAFNNIKSVYRAKGL